MIRSSKTRNRLHSFCLLFLGNAAKRVWSLILNYSWWHWDVWDCHPKTGLCCCHTSFSFLNLMQNIQPCSKQTLLLIHNEKSKQAWQSKPERGKVQNLENRVPRQQIQHGAVLSTHQHLSVEISLFISQNVTSVEV